MSGTYTVREVAELLAVSRSTVERLLADRTLTSVKVRRAVRIPAAEVDALITAYINQHTTA